MKYSCPLWSKDEGGVRGDLEGYRRPGDLEAAQDRMIKYVLKKAQLKSGDRLLEIGSGWGCMAIEASIPSPVRFDYSLFKHIYIYKGSENGV